MPMPRERNPSRRRARLSLWTRFTLIHTSRQTDFWERMRNNPGFLECGGAEAMHC
jgi:hypothetical protein